MIELMDLVLIMLICGFFSLVFSVILAFIAIFLKDNSINRRISGLEDEFDSHVKGDYAITGNQVLKEKKELITQAEMAIGTKLASGVKPMDLIKDPELVQYLPVMPDLLKKYAKAFKD